MTVPVTRRDENVRPFSKEPEGAVMLGCEHPHEQRRELSLQAIGQLVEASEEVQVEAEDRQQLYG